MTDTATAPEQAEQATPAEAPKPAKTIKQPHDCYCQSFELVDPEDKESTFTTGCTQTTLSTFAQGHDARLVSFLVDGYFDKYTINGLAGGKTVMYKTPAEAAATASDALGAKAEKATQNKQEKLNGAAERKAARDALKAKKAADKAAAAAAKAAEKETKAAEAKASAPKAAGAEVVAGSATGDVAPLAEGQVRIKVGRWEYTATQLPDGGVEFTNGKGEVETRAEGDGYQVLATYQAS